MAKDLSVSVLMDFYGELLTPKQLEALDSYYNQDLSLAEIALEMEVSRQGVRNFIKTGEQHLAEFEEKLNLAERFININKIADKMAKTIKSLPDCDGKSGLLSDIDSIKSQL
ncbi:MAG: DNA-binding protein [Ruminococcaceae bacterium]|nr:DNA-binding protein [Oscillospiraceae bacterium]